MFSLRVCERREAIVDAEIHELFAPTPANNAGRPYRTRPMRLPASLRLNRVLVGAIRRSKRGQVNGYCRAVAGALAAVVVEKVEPQIERIRDVGGQETGSSGVAIAAFG
jgi:hypothetical protein